MQADRQLEVEIEYVMSRLATWGCGESLKTLEGELRGMLPRAGASPPPAPEEHAPPPAPAPAQPPAQGECEQSLGAVQANVDAFVDQVLLSQPQSDSAVPPAQRIPDAAESAKGEASGRLLPFPFEPEPPQAPSAHVHVDPTREPIPHMAPHANAAGSASDIAAVNPPTSPSAPKVSISPQVPMSPQAPQTPKSPQMPQVLQEQREEEADDWTGDEDPGFIRVPLLEPEEMWKPEKGRRRPSFRLGGGITARERESLLREKMDGVYAQLQREVETYKAEQRAAEQRLQSEAADSAHPASPHNLHPQLPTHGAPDGSASPPHASSNSPTDTKDVQGEHVTGPSDSVASDSVLARASGTPDNLGECGNGVPMSSTPVSEAVLSGHGSPNMQTAALAHSPAHGTSEGAQDGDEREPPAVQPYDLVQPPPPAPQLEKFSLQVIYEKGKTGFEENQDYPVKRDHVIAGRYQIVEYIGSAAFSHAVQCLDLWTGHYVCVKIIKNSKDFFDQSLDEIKLLQYINRSGDADEHCVLQLYDYFYHKEHLFLVSELLRDNLYEFSKYNRSTGDAPYFTVQRLQKITKQILIALQFIHNLNLIHCDLKPENILIRSFSRCEVKVIDFGSSCFTHDHLSSYIQSRCYRAPEVVLGLPYDQRIDIWSLGAILPELLTGHVLFYNDSLSTMLCRISAICGPFPSHMLVHARHAHKYVTKTGAFYEDRGATKKGQCIDLLFPRRTTIRRRMGNCRDDLFVDFVTQLLQIDPTKRPTAAQALDHPWFKVDYGPIPKLSG